MPREAVIPPPDPPVLVTDERFTIKAPTNDRNELCKALIHLSKKVFKALDDDCAENKRYARRLKIVNQRYLESPRRLTNEEMLVEMPYEASSWNDLEHDYLEVCIFSRIQKEEHNKLWYKVRIEFDQFMSEQTKLLMDQMDEGYEVPLMLPSDIKVISDIQNSNAIPQAEHDKQSTSGVSYTPEVNLNQTRQRQTVQVNTPILNSHLKDHKEIINASELSQQSQKKTPPPPRKHLPKEPAQVVEPIIVRDEDDDDDDMPVVVYESVQTKKVAVPDDSVR